ncbi:MAG: pseudouridine synthase [Proteobacteria bacterium]|jgi:23S rRNA pseudouridine2605 synthase|nr:pseudouridine synthase [Pseudomonadota bacterium]
MLEKIRLNKYISLCGVCSRRDADRYIDQGRVSVDGAVAKQPAPLVDGSEVITVDGKPIQTVDDVKVWAFYKPAGLVTTHRDEQGRETVFEYLREQGVDERVISVGRLDLNSEGLLLLTNNGEFSRFAESPQTEWKRVYRVRVFGDITNLDIDALQEGITIDGVTYREVNVEPEKDFAQKGQNSWLQVTLTEGKNREIRRIMDYFDLSVNRLIRTSYGPYELGDLQPGEWRDEVVIRD